MMKIYVMFAVIGWAWTILVGVVLLPWWLKQRERRSGFDVVVPNEEQH